MRTNKQQLDHDGRIGLYVHFPWCVKKCPYCDFNSHPLKKELPETQYNMALYKDLTALFNRYDFQITTIFFGGGTPSLFSADSFSKIIELCSSRLEEEAEITIEANPGVIEHGSLKAFYEAGINRISFGAQTFSDNQLQKLGRVHKAGDIEKSFEEARLAGFSNINLDLMYGLPNQSLTSAIDDLIKAVEMGPEHLSWYQLTIEDKTEFARKRPILTGEFELENIEMEGQALLATSGFNRYEVSAYSKNGQDCRHNTNYWNFGNYAGVGAGAHGKFRYSGKTLRTHKVKQPRLYQSNPETLVETVISEDNLTVEFMMNALRLTQGVPFERFTATTGISTQKIEPYWERLVLEGLVETNKIAATPYGFRYLDAIIQRFL
tara:strand:+ start:31 stop:1164 length:1134 start_codon:yes stop_codon:yes gene_type:complete